MNERIREIAVQSGLQPFEDCGPGYVAKMEKFAQLVWEEAYQKGFDDGWTGAMEKELG